MSGALDRDGTYRLLGEGACALAGQRAVVRVSGPDARGWLQGQLSQDVSTLGPGVSAESLVLSPQGRIESYCRASVLADDAWLLDTAPGHGEALAARLARFRLRVKVELRSEVASSVRLRGPQAAGVLERAGLQAGARRLDEGTATSEGHYLVVAEVAWPRYSGYDIVSSAGAPAVLEGMVPFGDAAAFEAARIEAGVPEMGSELDERVIPQEAGDLVAHAVSFTKGCYTGQELVARLEARGSNVARRLLGVVMSEPGAAAGDVVVAEGREVGRLTSVAWSPGLGAEVALAYVARRIAPRSPANVGESLRRADLRELPLEIG